MYTPGNRTNIEGFNFVNEFQCGVQAVSLDEDAIRNAVLEIRSNYPLYVENAKKAARHFSFDKAVKPYLDFVEAYI